MGVGNAETGQASLDQQTRVQTVFTGETQKLIATWHGRMGLSRDEMIQRVDFFIIQGCPQEQGDEHLKALLLASEKTAGVEGLEALVRLMEFCQWELKGFNKAFNAITRGTRVRRSMQAVSNLMKKQFISSEKIDGKVPNFSQRVTAYINKRTR